MAFETLLYYPDQDEPLMPDFVEDMDFYETRELYQRVEKRLRSMIDGEYKYYKPTKEGIVFGTWDTDEDKLTHIDKVIEKEDERKVIQWYMETDGGMEVPTKLIMEKFLAFLGTTLMEKHARDVLTQGQRNDVYYGWRKLCRYEERNQFNKVDWIWQKIDGNYFEDYKYRLGIHKALAPFKDTCVKCYKLDPHAFGQEESMAFYQKDPFNEMSDEEQKQYFKPFRDLGIDGVPEVYDPDHLLEDIQNSEMWGPHDRDSWIDKGGGKK